MDALAEARREGRVKLLGLGEMAISTKPEDILCAPNLGSCLGISVHDAAKPIGGMIHCVLPSAATNPDKAKTEPYMFVDVGLVSMLNELIQRGANKKNLIIAVAGGSNIADLNNVFEIGKKNHTIFRKVMWKNGLLVKAENVGGSISRTISLDIGTGEVLLKMNGETSRLV